MADPGHDLDLKLLEILVCPLTKGPLSYDAEAQELISEQANLAYPIRDGIPIMLVDEARVLDDGGGAKATPPRRDPDQGGG
ncbi:MAG: Trm112 family protein [Alphaproteobacteria bacterium]